jgi:hypothetical protein
VGPTANLEILEGRKSACAGIQALDHPAYSLITILTMISWLILLCSKESQQEIIPNCQRKHVYNGRRHDCESTKKIFVNKKDI